MNLSRRTLIASAAIIPLVVLPGCAGTGAFSLVEAIRRLLSLSSQRAFASLLRENGFFDDQITRISLPDAIGGARAGGVVTALLRSKGVRDRMLIQVNRAAEKGAEAAAPIVTQAIRSISIDDAVLLVRGGPTAATDALSRKMGGALVIAMAPQIDGGLKLFDNAIVSEVLRAATGIDFAGLRDDVNAKASAAIYRAIGREETAIRTNPRATGDPLLIGVFGLLK